MRGLAEFWAGKGGVLGGFSQGACHSCCQDPRVLETMNLEGFPIKLTAVEAAFLLCDHTDSFASETSFSVYSLFRARFSHARLHCVGITWVLIEDSCTRVCGCCLFSDPRDRVTDTHWTHLSC